MPSPTSAHSSVGTHLAVFVEKRSAQHDDFNAAQMFVRSETRARIKGVQQDHVPATKIVIQNLVSDGLESRRGQARPRDLVGADNASPIVEQAMRQLSGLLHLQHSETPSFSGSPLEYPIGVNCRYLAAEAFPNVSFTE